MGNGTRYDRFTANEIDRERFKERPKFYDTRYSNRACSRCGERKGLKGGKQVRNANGTRTFICANCKDT